MASIQFRGIDSVMRAYDLGADSDTFWAVCAGKNQLHRGQGKEELKRFLDLIKGGESSAIYTLKIYDDVDSVKQIKERTEASLSYNFNLDGAGGTREYYTQLEARIKQIEEGPEDEEEESVMTKIGNAAVGLLGDPDKLLAAINGLPNLFNSIAGIFQSPQAPQVIGRMIENYMQPAAQVAPHTFDNNGPVSGVNNNNIMSAEEQNQILANALDQLEKADPKIVSHLDKLAKLSVSNPQLFNMLISQVDNL